MKSRTDWREKLERSQVVFVPPMMSRFGKGTIPDDGSLNPNFPGGRGLPTLQLRPEEFNIARTGKKTPAVRQFERSLYTLK